MALSFDDLPDEASAPVPKAQAAPQSGGLSFDDLPDEAPAPKAGGMAGALMAAQPAQQAQSDIDPMQLYYGAARSVDNMGLALGRMVGIPAAQTFDWTRSQFTDQPTHIAQEYLNDKLAQLQARADSLAPKENDSLPNKIMNATGGFGGNLAAMAATGGLSRAPAMADAVATGALPRVLGDVGQATRAMAIPATVDSVNTGHDVYAETGDLPDALKAAAVTGAANVGMGLLPAALPGNLATRLISGAPIGALTGEGTRQLRNMALPETMQQPFNVQDALVNGLTGSVLAGALGRAPERRDVTPQPEPMQQPAQQQQAMPAPATVPSPAPAAPQAPTTPTPTPFAGSQDISPLLDRLGVQGEQRNTTLKLLEPVELNAEDARRGVQTNAERDRLAQLIGLQGTDAKVFNRKIGEALNAEQTVAAVTNVQDHLKDVLALQQRIATGQASDIDRASFIQSLGQLRSTFADLAGARAEAGRALSAYKRQAMDYNQAQAVLEAVNGAGGADNAALALGKAMQSGGLSNAAKLIRQPEGKMSRLLGYYYRAALLSGVRTHAVNITSNTMTLGNEIIERGIAAGVSGVKNVFKPGSGQTVFAEPVDMLVGMAKNTMQAGRAAGDAFRTGESPMLGGGKQETDTSSMNSPRPPGALPTAAWAADRVASLPYRALGAEDAWFASLGYAGEMRTLARQQAVAEKKLGTLPPGMKLSQRIDAIVQNPTAKMIEAAGEHARTVTFNSQAGDFTQTIMRAKAKMPWLNLIVPFIRTPVNIVKYGAKRTPLAGFMPSVRADIMAGGAKQERAIARILWGTSVMVGAGALAQAGYITGAGPEDKEEKAALMATGWRPYSIKVDDTYHEYSRLDPFSQWLGLASDLATMDYQHKDASDLATTTLSSLVNNTINKTYMQGVSNLVEFLQDPQRNGKWYLRQMAGTLAQPVTLASNIASENDPYARQSTSVLDAIKYRIPGLRQDLPAKLDQFGEPVPNRTYPGGPFSIAAPIAQSKETTDPVRLEVGRLGWAPGKAQDHFTIKKQRYDLSDEQLNELEELSGKLLRKSMQRAMQSKGWAALGDDEKRDFLDAELKKARTAVRLALIPLVATGNRRAIDKLRNATGGTK
ncbi:hypothetical protein [Pseudomonas sp. G(2018)]|uniref:hypothetical protein n=1 Tax=Pseudomonas sp. G(2018) TaxID=2502242 RepID=UPI0010F90DE5|nr:hypothetical protein [Pseudomonas sp. G(2018)]